MASVTGKSQRNAKRPATRASVWLTQADKYFHPLKRNMLQRVVSPYGAELRSFLKMFLKEIPDSVWDDLKKGEVDPDKLWNFFQALPVILFGYPQYDFLVVPKENRIKGGRYRKRLNSNIDELLKTIEEMNGLPIARVIIGNTPSTIGPVPPAGVLAKVPNSESAYFDEFVRGHNLSNVPLIELLKLAAILTRTRFTELTQIEDFSDRIAREWNCQDVGDKVWEKNKLPRILVEMVVKQLGKNFRHHSLAMINAPTMMKTMGRTSKMNKKTFKASLVRKRSKRGATQG